MKNGIDIKQYKKYITKFYGKKCPEYSYHCLCCMVWQTYDELKGMLEWDEVLEKGLKNKHEKRNTNKKNNN